MIFIFLFLFVWIFFLLFLFFFFWHSKSDAGQLRRINPEDKSLTDEPFKFDISDSRSKNQENYDAVGEVITEYVFKLLSEMGLHKIYVPSPETPDSVFVFGTKPSFENTDKLLILIHGSGVVRAGQWARSLIINHSLDHGTQIPYIKRAIAEGYDVLLMNSNVNYRYANGKRAAIKGHSTPEEHVVTVWKQLIQPVFKTIECFAIIGHSYGGIATVALTNADPMAFMNKGFAIGFTDSVHSASDLSREMLEWCQLVCVWDLWSMWSMENNYYNNLFFSHVYFL